jgi:hypothetical protein
MNAGRSQEVFDKNVLSVSIWAKEKGVFKNLVKNQGLKQLFFCMIKPGGFRSIIFVG